ncbi:C2H2-like zinc finger protein [Zea mays]|uniref:C2H2-like zinc finger protein n=1 Tax=Zea mays TaxID=4577 RepID=A0A1D6IXD4_MAIZE|nr:C2H2-like zinc finger protein [Zea mays]
MKTRLKESLATTTEGSSTVGELDAHRRLVHGWGKQTNRLYLALSILTLILLPLFYLIVFLHQREMRKGTQDLKRFSKIGQKKKPS